MNEDLRLTQQSINYEKKKKKDKPDENTSLLSKGEDEGDIESGKKKKRTPRKSMKSPRKSMRSSSNMFKNKQPKQKIANYKNYEERVEGEFEDKCYEIVKSENWE
jgi:HD-GYP domain-containing protein (c-di-GMP phosphodiesterase class II)